MTRTYQGRNTMGGFYMPLIHDKLAFHEKKKTKKIQMKVDKNVNYLQANKSQRFFGSQIFSQQFQQISVPLCCNSTRLCH